MLIRILRHFMTSHWKLKKLFSAEVMQRIGSVIAQAEQKHSGEIRFVVEAVLPWRYLWCRDSTRERALNLFSKLRVWDTEQNTGVLIYLLFAEKSVEIIADRALARAISQPIWDDICLKMKNSFRQGQFEKGVIIGIETISAHLVQHFPSENIKTNQLPDQPIIM